MRDFEEYEFRLPDGSKRYEMIDLTQPEQEQIKAMMSLHGAISAIPLSQVEDENKDGRGKV